MLPEFAEVCTAEAPEGARVALWQADEFWEMLLYESLHAGASASEVVKSQQFVANELVVGRFLEGEEIVEESDNLMGPDLCVIAAAGFDAEGGAVFAPSIEELVEARLADLQVEARLGAGELSGVEIGQSFGDKS